MNISGTSLAGLTVEKATLNSYFRQKHLEIKTAESSNENILTVRLSWTILHYTDNLIGCEKKWQFKIKAFKWDNLFHLKISPEKKKKVMYLVLHLFIFYLICPQIYMTFSGNFCKSLKIKWRNRIYNFVYIHA